jgi:hypothetical protein
VNRETIIGALFNKLTGPPLVVAFTADTTTGDTVLANVSDPSGLMAGMPVAGDGVPLDATIATITPTVTLSLPAIADRTAAPLVQGFLTTARRMADPNVEQDMPSLYLVEGNEVHAPRPDGAAALVELNCEAWIYTRVGAAQNAVPAAMLNVLIDGIERAIYSNLPRSFRQNLGVHGVLYCRIEGEVQKDPGHSAQMALAVIPIKIVVGQSAETFTLS